MKNKDIGLAAGFAYLVYTVLTGALTWYSLNWFLGKQPAWYVFVWVWIAYLAILHDDNK